MPKQKPPKKSKRPKEPKLPKEKKAKKPLFGKKKPKEPVEKEQKAPEEKKPRKPLFKSKKVAPEVAGPEPATAATAGPSEETPSKPAKKPLFGKKGGAPKQPKQPKTKKPKEPKAKKPKEPRKKKAGAAMGSKVSPVGLDLGRSSITAVRLRHQTAGSVLLQAELDALPEGLIQEGEVRDVEGLAFAIREFWKTHKIKGRKVALGLANQKIVVRSLDFPLLDEKELRSAIEFQAQDYIPIPIDEAVFDYHILGHFTDHDGVEKQKVLVVAAQKDMVMDFINAVKRARLQVASVDLQAFALLRSQITRTFLDEGAPTGTAIAIANIASDVTNLVVDVAGEPQFTRIISFGGDDFTKSVQEQMGVTFPEAEVMKVQFGLLPPGAGAPGGGVAAGGPSEQKPTPEAETQIIPPAEMGEEPSAPQGAPEGMGGPFGPTGLTPGEGGQETPSPEREGGAEPPASEHPPGLWPPAPQEPAEGEKEDIVHRVLEITTEALADEIRRSLDYYMSQESSIPIGKLLISGGGSMLPNLDVHLSQLFPFPVEFGNPLLRIAQNKSGLSEEELSVLAPRLAIAIGLSLEDES